ncbi:sensor histidine kinase [Aureimonas sp. AU40]|uniref:sensor histidine kinase n=1 Tax=Aureimonas sp. AU40 TaxID=1637747 RepID=UPI000AE60CAD|nr:PAS domain-containing sensor histidine kinase [Aureimonas sp. AU40]
MNETGKATFQSGLPRYTFGTEGTAALASRKKGHELDRISFQQLFNALPSPHMLLDAQLHFVAVNPAYEAVTDHSGQTLVGRHVFEAFPNTGEAGRRLRHSLDRVRETGKPDTLAYIEYDIPIPPEKGGGMAKRYWTAIHTPLNDETGAVRYILQNTVDITELVLLREAASTPNSIFSGGVALVQRAREAEEAIRDDTKPAQQFRALFEEAPGMVALLHGADHVFTYANRAYRHFVGQREVLGLPVRDVFPEIEGEGFFEKLDEAYRTGEAALGFESRIMLRDPETGRLREFFIDFSYHPVVASDGTTSGIFVQGYDRTESVRAQRRQRLLLDELNHRVKNTLSTVQSLARRSFRATTDREEARRVFEGRILALSNAHNLLSEQHWEAADLATIARLELAALGSDRFEMQGDPLSLNPKAAIALAMVFHELASNAVKYGVLSGRDGRLAVRWDVRDDNLHLVWNEAGARLPLSEGELKPGFGMRMLERIVTGELEGRLELALGSSGLTWTLVIPMAEVSAARGPSHD